MKLVYDPSAGGEIARRFCHLVIDSVDVAMQRTSITLQHDYFKLTTDRQLTSVLSAEVGHDYAGKRSSVSVFAMLVCHCRNNTALSVLYADRNTRTHARSSFVHSILAAA